MYVPLTVTMIVTALSFSTSLSNAAEAESDKAKFSGTWKITSVSSDGNVVKNQVIGAFTFSKGAFVMEGNGARTGKFRIDSTKDPKHLDLIFAGERGVPVPVKAIYKFAGDKLTICTSDVNKSRPTQFRYDAEAKQSLLHLTKVKRAKERPKTNGFWASR